MASDGTTSPPEPAPPPDPAGNGASTAWAPPGGDTSAADLDTAVLLSDVQLAMDRLPDWDGAPLLASYGAARATGSDTCPGESSLVDDDGVQQTWWYGACRSDAGVHFNGVMTAWAWSGLPVARRNVWLKPGYEFVAFSRCWC